MKTLQNQSHDVSNRNKLIAELSYKFVTYIIIGINVLFLAPYVFRTIGCERATFHTEVWVDISQKSLSRNVATGRIWIKDYILWITDFYEFSTKQFMWASLQWKQMSRTVGILIPNIKNQTLRNIKFIFGYAEFEWWKVVWFVLYSNAIRNLHHSATGDHFLLLEYCVQNQIPTVFRSWLNTCLSIITIMSWIPGGICEP